jgi:hypothetical protein
MNVTICRLAFISSTKITHCTLQVNTESAVSYKEVSSFEQIIAVACENHRNTLGGQTTAFINIKAGGTDSYHGALNDSDQRQAQSCVAIHLRLSLLTHSTRVNVCFTATVNQKLVLNYTACCSGCSQKLGNTIERLLKLPQKSGTRYEDNWNYHRNIRLHTYKHIYCTKHRSVQRKRLGDWYHSFAYFFNHTDFKIFMFIGPCIILIVG